MGADEVIAPEIVEWERAQVDIKSKERGRGQNRIVCKEQKINLHFERYYQKLGIVEENEWEKFYEALKTPLDVAFRINSIS